MTDILMKRFIALFLLAACIMSGVFWHAGRAEAQSPGPDQWDVHDAVILIYHRFGEGRWPSTNVTLEQFEAHLDYLTDNGFNVASLPDVVAAFRDKRPLPPKTVVITVDDAYASVMTEAWPRLKARGFPLTLFVSTEPVDEKFSGYLSWDQIRQLQAEGVTIGHHGHSHGSFLDLGLEGTLSDIDKASERLKAELGQVPDIIAYPYGEYDGALRTKMEELGFKAALAQYSSVASAEDSLYEIPRFALNENYAGMNRFKLIANARALPVLGVIPTDPRITNNPPAFGFTVADAVRGLSAMSCFPSHLPEAATMTMLGEHRVEIRFEKPFPKGRSRINCTMPGPSGRWYWFGRPFFVTD
jgi:peptidoglycan/xylan/chitin deacetylase (PgdA/CDA1 family)